MKKFLVNKRRLTWIAFSLGVIILSGAIAPAITHASTIIRSKSNIANNRMIVISSTINQPNAPDGGHVLLLNTETGELWDYSYKALTGNALPKYVSTMQEPGEAVIVNLKYR